jgi:hypothetical protein
LTLTQKGVIIDFNNSTILEGTLMNNKGEISVTNRIIRSKAIQLLDLYQKTLGTVIPIDIKEQQQIVCEEMLFYCCEHSRPEQFLSLNMRGIESLGEELYMISFLFWGTTEERIVPFKHLNEKLQDAYTLMARKICEWWKNDELPKPSEDGNIPNDMKGGETE